MTNSFTEEFRQYWTCTIRTRSPTFFQMPSDRTRMTLRALRAFLFIAPTTRISAKQHEGARARDTMSRSYGRVTFAQRASKSCRARLRATLDTPRSQRWPTKTANRTMFWSGRPFWLSNFACGWKDHSRP